MTDELCTWCLGTGSIRVPAMKAPSAFGLIAREASAAIPCPLCGGKGRR